MLWARKSVNVRSHQKYEVLYIPNLPAQLRRCGPGLERKLEARGWYRDSRVTRGGREKQRTLLANKTRGLATREGEGGRSRLALEARVRVTETERECNRNEKDESRGRVCVRGEGDGVRVREMERRKAGSARGGSARGVGGGRATREGARGDGPRERMCLE